MSPLSVVSPPFGDAPVTQPEPCPPRALPDGSASMCATPAETAPASSEADALPAGYWRRVSRNTGLISAAEQQRLATATVAIAGVGGDGGLLAVTLARMGVRRFRLADPEVFEVENLNRQAASQTDTIGRNKAEAIAARLRAISDDVTAEVFSDGINPDNVDAFVEGCDLVVDETEYTLHHLAGC